MDVTYSNQIGPALRLPDGSLESFALPGGYPILYLDSHNEVLCPACATVELLTAEIDRAWAAADWAGAVRLTLQLAEISEKEARYYISYQAGQWDMCCRDEDDPDRAYESGLDARDCPVAWDIHYEGAPEFYANCNTMIESAYGDPDEEDEEESN